jgi:heme O synthase-like polyprenyltransferase
MNFKETIKKNLFKVSLGFVAGTILLYFIQDLNFIFISLFQLCFYTIFYTIIDKILFKIKEWRKG